MTDTALLAIAALLAAVVVLLGYLAYVVRTSANRREDSLMYVCAALERLDTCAADLLVVCTDIEQHAAADRT